jgi:hypothetical protein|nr:MAG TPA: hypothetical protein [Bacteriophage sp.]
MTVLNKAVLINYDRLSQMIESNTVDEETVYFLSGKDVIRAIKNIQIPSVEGLAKTAEIESTYAKKTELPDVSDLAIKTEVVTKNDFQLIINELKKINGEV